MESFIHELRLAWLIVLSAGLFVLCHRATRGASSPWARMRDAVAIWLVCTYPAVALPGIAGILGPVLVAGAALLACTLLLLIARTPPGQLRPTQAPNLWNPAPALFAVGFLLGMAYLQRFMPVISTDPLVYHLPTAVHWLQNRSLAMYDVWYWMPANTYSPLAGTTWTVWLMVFLGNDALARFVQLLAVALLLPSLIALLRGVGVRPMVATPISAAAILSGPVITQALLPKDDLFVLAILVAIISACRPDELRGAYGPLRIGLLLGLLLATKYTALLSLPILLLAADAPFRARWTWRQWLIAIALPVLIAGPWYVRNWIITGNPLYPVDFLFFKGMFAADRSENLATLGGLWDMLTNAERFHTVAPWMLVLLIVLWMAALVTSMRALRSEPVTRVVLLGPLVGAVTFVMLSPHAEIRYMFPVLILLFPASAIAIDKLLPKTAATAVAIALVPVTLASTFGVEARSTWILVTIGTITAAAGVVLSFIASRMTELRRLWIGTGAIAGVVLAGCIFVYWRAFLFHEYGYAALTELQWQKEEAYGSKAVAWSFVRNQTPPDSTIAFANATHVYPLYGFDLTRELVYASVRPGVKHLHDLPRLPARVRADDVIKTMGTWTSEGADEQTWLTNLQELRADYLYVSKNEASDAPVELRFASNNPSRFVKLFENEDAVVYQINVK